jgi:hypothetical protein
MRLLIDNPGAARVLLVGTAASVIEMRSSTLLTLLLLFSSTMQAAGPPHAAGPLLHPSEDSRLLPVREYQFIIAKIN